MSAKIISLVPTEQGNKAPQTNTYHYAFSAWNFAQTLLWKDQIFPKGEIEQTQRHIQGYFDNARDKKAAFIAFCERVLLTNKYQLADESRYVPLPSVWFNRYNQHGFAGTKGWYQSIQQKRQEVPGYLQHLTVLAEQYIRYANKPSTRAFTTCRNKLMSLNATSLLQHFYNCIVHLSYVN